MRRFLFAISSAAAMFLSLAATGLAVPEVQKGWRDALRRQELSTGGSTWGLARWR